MRSWRGSRADGSRRTARSPGSRVFRTAPDRSDTRSRHCERGTGCRGTESSTRRAVSVCGTPAAPRSSGSGSRRRGSGPVPEERSTFGCMGGTGGNPGGSRSEDVVRRLTSRQIFHHMHHPARPVRAGCSWRAGRANPRSSVSDSGEACPLDLRIASVAAVRGGSGNTVDRRPCPQQPSQLTGMALVTVFRGVTAREWHVRTHGREQSGAAKVSCFRVRTRTRVPVVGESEQRA